MSRAPKKAKPRRRDVLTGDRRLIQGFVPPEGVPISFDVAGLSSRMIAQIADILITSAALVILLMILFFSDLLPLSGVVAIGAMLYFMIRVPYYTFSEILMNGQTLGKRMTGMRVIAADGRSLSSHSVTIRNLMKEMEIFVPGTLLLASASLDGATMLILIVWIGILLAVPLTNKNRQRLGDILAGTYVVMLPKPVLLPDLAEAPQNGTEIYNFLPHHLDHYGRYELQTLEALLQVPTATLNKVAKTRHEANLLKVSQTIAARIGYEKQVQASEAEAFLLAFYRTQRAYLENRKLFGDAREDKFHRDRGAEPSDVR